MGSWAGSELSACHISGIGVGELAQWPVFLTPAFQVKCATLRAPAAKFTAYSRLTTSVRQAEHKPSWVEASS